MAYVGQAPFQEFTNPPTKDSFTGDGSTVAFDMSAEVASNAQNALEVYVNNVRQEPGTGKAFTLGPDGSNDIKRITFTAAPVSGAAIYVINDKTNVSVTAPLNNDLNGTELILDGDGDTSITADTDDRIDFRLAGVEHFSFSNSSGDTIIKPMVDAKDIKFQQYDGNVLLDINDGNYVGIGGNSSAPGEIRFYEDTDNGSLYTGFKAGNVTGSVSYVLPLADGSANQQLTTDGSGTLSWANQGANPISADGDSLGTASLEWSDLYLADGGTIQFGNDQDVTLTHVADTALLLNAAMRLQFRDSGLYVGSNADGDLDIVSDGTAVDSINLESAGGITLDAGTAGSGVIYEDDGTEMLRIHNSSSDVILESKVSDKDIIFKVNDGGSATEVARFDGDVSALLIASGKKLMLGAAEEYLSGDGTDISFAVGSSGDINIPANIGLTFGDDGEKIEGDGTDLTISASADMNLTATTDINIPSNVGLTFGNDGEKIEGDGTDLTIAGNNINLTAVADVNIPSGVGLTFATGEKIESDGTDLTITVGSSGDINIGSNIGLTFGDDGEKIEGDGTDLTIAGNNINLTAVADVNIPSGVGLTFATGEKLESDGTDLSITVGSSGDINIPANIGLTFGDDGEKIEGDGTDLTITGNNINLTATADVVIPANVGITFGSGEKIEGDSTDLTITSGAKINLTATSDIHIPNDVGIVFGGDSEKIEGDGTDLVISANNLTIDAAADIILDAGGNDFNFKASGTEVLRISNSSSDVVIKPTVDAKDIIFQQYDGTEVARIEDNATFNVSSAGKFAYAGTAVTATAAELNYSDLATLGTSAASKVLTADANNLTKITGGVYLEEATLSFDATQDWDVRASPVAKVTLTANVTFDAPSNPTTGQYIAIVCIQDGTGSRTIAWNAVFEFTGDTAPTATTTASKGDMFTFRYNGSKWLEVGRNLNLTLS